MHTCQYCKNVFENGKSFGGHIVNCKKNPNYDNRRKNLSNSAKKRIIDEETKKKISKSRIKYLKEHPDEVPYRINHSSKDSYPEKIFKKALEDNNINGWIFKYQNSIYEYDFAFPDLKIDVEIDGSTHNQDKVKLIDERRDEFSRNEGWTILRFTAKEVKENIVKCINVLKRFIHVKYVSMNVEELVYPTLNLEIESLNNLTNEITKHFEVLIKQQNIHDLKSIGVKMQYEEERKEFQEKLKNVIQEIERRFNLKFQDYMFDFYKGQYKLIIDDNELTEILIKEECGL